MEDKLKYRKESLVNQDGDTFGVLYTIGVPTGAEPLDLQARLIEEVIGLERYHAQRDVWDQIRIEFEEVE